MPVKINQKKQDESHDFSTGQAKPLSNPWFMLIHLQIFVDELMTILQYWYSQTLKHSTDLGKLENVTNLNEGHLG